MTLEADASVRRGVTGLLAAQSNDGSWTSSIAVTALCLGAIINADLTGAPGGSETVTRGLDHLTTFLKRSLPTVPPTQHENTSSSVYPIALCIYPLFLANRPEDRMIVERSARYVKLAFVRCDPNNWRNAAGADARPLDLYRMHHIFEAISILEDDPPLFSYNNKRTRHTPSKFWRNALSYVTRCGSVDRVAAIGAESDTGSFSGFPAHPRTKPDTTAAADCAAGTAANYCLAGLAGLTYAGAADHPARSRAIEWLRSRFDSLKDASDCPARYTFLYLLSKIQRQSRVLNTPLTITQDSLPETIVNRVLASQAADGLWSGAPGHWGEDDPHLATALAIQALILASR